MLHFSSNATLFFGVGAVALIIWLDSRTGRSDGNRHSYARNSGESAAPPLTSAPIEPPPANVR